MKVAGTRQSTENTIRKNSYLTWLNRHEILLLSHIDDDDDDDTDDEEEKDVSHVLVAHVLESIEKFVMDAFVHESLHSSNSSSNDNNEDDVKVNNLLAVEDLQIAKYDQGGKFEEHHDGYGRFLTVLTYLNGVGGTFFPFAQTRQASSSCSKNSNDVEGKGEVELQLQSRDGLLVVGKEGIEAYTSSTLSAAGGGGATSGSSPADQDKIKPATVVHIEPGDAIVFYNYLLGERDLRSVHESLTVPCEKWIATNWVRCEKLTGPLANLYNDEIILPSASSRSRSSSSSSSMRTE